MYDENDILIFIIIFCVIISII